MTYGRRIAPKPYNGPAGRYGSFESIATILAAEKVLPASAARSTRQTKPDGFICASCAWGKPATPHPFGFCENGGKATAGDLTSECAGASVFVKHTLSDVEGWLAQGSIGAYLPETDPLLALCHRDRKARIPSYKAIPVRVLATTVVSAKDTAHVG